MTPRAILLSAAAQLYGFIWWGGSLLHNERAMAFSLEGEATIIHLDSRGGGWIPFSLFFV